jgi:hypothetical protein
MVNNLGQICHDTDHKTWKFPLLHLSHSSTTTVDNPMVLLTLLNSVKVWKAYLILLCQHESSPLKDCIVPFTDHNVPLPISEKLRASCNPHVTHSNYVISKEIKLCDNVGAISTFANNKAPCSNTVVSISNPSFQSKWYTWILFVLWCS